ncbi:MAG: FKBP-type peptidyl-prolyl cis-trans isomerase [Gemmatirosa sp.]|nr:FKBP-type peptidyl-prolyl cis-trans isomerase [Gemmatirosa sp.]
MRVTTRYLAAAAIAVISATAVQAQTPASSSDDSLASLAFAPSLGVDLARAARLPSGVYVRDVATGQGDSLRAGATVVLHFQIRQPDGQVVADVRTDARRWWPGTYVPGVEAGLRGMRAGGRRQLVVPTSAGSDGRVGPGLPVGTPLVVDIDVITVS